MIREIFEDDRGQLSSGRVFAGYCVVAALACWVSGLWLPALASHAESGTQAFLAAAAVFYGSGKAAERFGAHNVGAAAPTAPGALGVPPPEPGPDGGNHD